jgi:hypothetical protein
MCGLDYGHTKDHRSPAVHDLSAKAGTRRRGDTSRIRYPPQRLTGAQDVTEVQACSPGAYRLASFAAIYTRQAVLTVGNALNGSSFRGGARGFKLEALVKVSQHIIFRS